MAASKKPLPFSRLRYTRSRKNGPLSDASPLKKPAAAAKSSTPTESSIPHCRHAYPLYFTVDDLAWNRRKRIPGKLPDNLRPLSGKFADYKSEYKKKFRSFVIPSEALFGNWKNKKMKINNKEQGLRPEGEIDFNVEYYDSYVEYPPQQKQPSTKPPDQWENFESPAEFRGSTEHKEKYVMFKEARRAALARQSTSLKVEGDFEDGTETREKYQPVISDKATLARRNTTLKLEGDIDLSTETADKYKEFADVPRTKLIRRYSNLEIPREAIKSATEYTGSFTYPRNGERAPLIRSMENLHTEGEMEFEPEYKTSYVDFHPTYPNDIKFRKRNRLLNEGIPAKIDKFTQLRVKDAIRDGSSPRNPSPEYKHSFVEFPVHRPNFQRPRSNLSPVIGIEEKVSELNAKYKPFKIDHRTKSLRPSTHLKPEGEIRLSPEYDAAFVDFSSDPTIYRPRRCTMGDQDRGSFSILDDRPDPATILNRSADRRFQKGKRLPMKNSDESSTDTCSKSDSTNQTIRPPFRMEVTNPDVVHKPFEKFNSDQSFVVLDENNNRNQWIRNKQKQDRWSPSWKGL